MTTPQAPTMGRALIALTAGAMLISFSGVWVKFAHVAPTVSAFYRVFLGTLKRLPRFR